MWSGRLKKLRSAGLRSMLYADLYGISCSNFSRAGQLMFVLELQRGMSWYFKKGIGSIWKSSATQSKPHVVGLLSDATCKAPETPPGIRIESLRVVASFEGIATEYDFDTVGHLTSWGNCSCRSLSRPRCDRLCSMILSSCVMPALRLNPSDCINLLIHRPLLLPSDVYIAAATAEASGFKLSPQLRQPTSPAGSRALPKS